MGRRKEKEKQVVDEEMGSLFLPLVEFSQTQETIRTERAKKYLSINTGLFREKKANGWASPPHDSVQLALFLCPVLTNHGVRIVWWFTLK